MKRILFTFLFLAVFLAGYAQLSNNGGIITIENGATLVIEGNYTSSGTGIIEIDGNVQLKGNFINNNSGGSVINANSDGTLTFNSTTAAQEIGGTASTDFGCAVVVNNALGVSLTGADAVLSKALTLTNGKLTLNAYDLTMAAVGITATNGWIVTNDAAGELKAVVETTDVAFPVGTASSYNPVILKNDGTPDTYGVVYSDVMPGGWTGADHYVDGSWTVSEAVADGSLLTVTPQWNSSQEVLPFDRADCAVGVSEDLGATVNWASSGAAIGTDPYYRSGDGFTDVGTFLVGDAFYLFITLNLDLFLAGPYNGVTMSTALNTNGVIPVTDPYLGTVTVGAIPAAAVDWVLVQFRDKTNSSNIMYQRPYFLDNAGNLLNTDGALGAQVTGVPKDQYYISVKHRNHLGVMTASTVDLLTDPSFDFTLGLGVYGTNPLRNIDGVYALWAGDTDGNGSVQFTTGTSDITPISNAVVNDPNNLANDPTFIGALVYNLADADMNATVQFTTGTSDITPVSASVLNNPANTLSDPTVILSQQLP